MGAIIIKGNIDENKKKEVQDIGKKRLFNAHKHCGIIKWKKDPGEISKGIKG